MKRKREDWVEAWEVIRKIREIRDAPVDLLGCDKLADKGEPEEVYNFQVLVAAMLSSQTRDQKTAEAMASLKAKPGGLSIESVLSSTDLEIGNAIRGVSFHNTKAKHIRQAACVLKNEHDSKLPRTLPELLKFPGVGPKMANLVLHCAFNQNDGIVVDTHVHRICSLLGWGCKVCDSCSKPEHTRVALEQWLPRELWAEFTVTLVGLGQLLQSDKGRLADKCSKCDNPDEALKLMKRLGLK